LALLQFSDPQRAAIDGRPLRLLGEHLEPGAARRSGYNQRGYSYSCAMIKLRALWSGDLPLGQAFWAYAVAGGVAVNGATALLLLALLAADRPIAALLLGYGLPMPYNVAALVGVWRSAGRHEGKRLHAELARIITPILILVLSVL
jgi:hypothetical protein